MEINEKVTFELIFIEKQRKNMIYEGFPRFPKKPQDLELEKVIMVLLTSCINYALFWCQSRNRTIE